MDAQTLGVAFGGLLVVAGLLWMLVVAIHIARSNKRGVAPDAAAAGGGGLWGFLEWLIKFTYKVFPRPFFPGLVLVGIGAAVIVLSLKYGGGSSGGGGTSGSAST